jgi:hypothetical protein
LLRTFCRSDVEVAEDCPEVAEDCPEVAEDCPEVAEDCPEAAEDCPPTIHSVGAPLAEFMELLQLLTE